MIENFKGLGVALATPFNADDSIAYDHLNKLMDHVCPHVNYLVLLGTTGESPAIYPEERNEIIRFVFEKNAGRLPIMVGFSGNFTHNLVTKMEEIDASGIDAFLISSPHYNKPSQTGIIRHFEAVADKSPRPILLYNVPHRTASNMTAETTLTLADHQNIFGIKEASGDLDQARKIIQNSPEGFLTVSGDDQMTEAIIRAGGQGVISVVANAYPATMATCLKSWLAGEENRNTVLEKAIEMCGKEGNPTSVKGALAALGLITPYTRLPLMPPSDELIRSFESLYLRH